MCTVSWQWRQHSESAAKQLSLYFNRDERRTREIALLPEVTATERVSVIRPIDPQRGGTWIASNSSGITVALLNNYSVPIDLEKTYESRGQLVSQVVDATSLDQAMSNVYACVSQHHYPAFSLLIWDYTSGRTQLFSWNELVLDHQTPLEEFLTSSSWNTDKVQAYRRQCYLDAVVNGDTPAAKFHATEIPNKVKESVFMSRELTQTVSRTYITVTADKVSLEYYDRSTDQTSHHDMPLSIAL